MLGACAGRLSGRDERYGMCRRAASRRCGRSTAVVFMLPSNRLLINGVYTELNGAGPDASGCLMVEGG
jgi:hypothetical protein